MNQHLLYQHRLLRIVPLAYALLMVCSGCENGAFSYDGNQTVFYRLGNVERSLHWDPDPSGQSRETRQMIKALQLYEEGKLTTARQVGETLLEGEWDATATKLLAVIDTRYGHDCEATCRLEEGIKRHPDEAGLRKTLAWNLCELHEYDRALLAATKAAEEIDDVALWDLVAAVRKDREKWQATLWEKSEEQALELEQQTLWFKFKRLMKVLLLVVMGVVSLSIDKK